MSFLKNVETHLMQIVNIPEHQRGMFFKTGPGEYSEHDQFLGVRVPTLRSLVKDYAQASPNDLKSLLSSTYNEVRLLALLVLVEQYQNASEEDQKTLVAFYLKHSNCVNNWNLVDLSAYQILGDYLLYNDRDILLKLVSSKNMWERRIAVVSTYAFIRKGDLQWTFRLAEYLLDDTEDLMHKATGWMLREAGKKDEKALQKFLTKHIRKLPRTTLRYAIERFNKSDRKHFMKL